MALRKETISEKLKFATILTILKVCQTTGFIPEIQCENDEEFIDAR
jgi:hypothetical protein